jgi:peptidoglycan/xylan/chitin deacetylase (PgdA/CDA1 family)
MRALVLAYHSHNITGNEYHNNDHVALEADLLGLTEAGARIVSLDAVVEALRKSSIDDSLDDEPCVAITFDDGPVFDVQDFEDRKYGHQRGFANIMEDFRSRHPGAQPGLQATSFVIASPDARAAMEIECGFQDQGHWLTDSWWHTARGESLLRVGNHSWDHVHPAVHATATQSDVRGNFAVVDSYPDARAEISAARQYIENVAGVSCQYFAYPFGHTNQYLATNYLPGFQAEHGAVAAFTTDGRRVRGDESIWTIPRVVCGYHWRSPAELRNLLFG